MASLKPKEIAKETWGYWSVHRLEGSYSYKDVIRMIAEDIEAYAKDYALACLEKAAEKVKVKVEKFSLKNDSHLDAVVIPDQNNVDLAILVDKESVTNPDNLA